MTKKALAALSLFGQWFRQLAVVVGDENVVVEVEVAAMAARVQAELLSRNREP
jgi:hypothetical protein